MLIRASYTNDELSRLASVLWIEQTSRSYGMTAQLSQERNVSLETVVATFADDILSVELSPGLVRIALSEIRSDHRGQAVVRSSIPVAHLVMPNETARRLAEVLAAAIQEMNTVTQAGMRMAFVTPIVSPTLPVQRKHTNL